MSSQNVWIHLKVSKADSYSRLLIVLIRKLLFSGCWCVRMPQKYTIKPSFPISMTTKQNGWGKCFELVTVKCSYPLIFFIIVCILPKCRSLPDQKFMSGIYQWIYEKLSLGWWFLGNFQQAKPVQSFCLPPLAVTVITLSMSSWCHKFR